MTKQRQRERHPRKDISLSFVVSFVLSFFFFTSPSLQTRGVGDRGTSGHGMVLEESGLGMKHGHV